MIIPKQEIIRNEAHLVFITYLPCVMTGEEGGDFAQFWKKYDIKRYLPLSKSQRYKLSRMGAPDYWGDLIDRAIWLSGLLWDNTGDFEKCERLIEKWKKE